MRVHADLSRCQGYGNCVQSAPDVFDLDDASGQVVILNPDPPPDLHEATRAAVANCPVEALSLEDDA